MENKNEDLPLNQELEKSPALRMFVSHSYPCTLNREEARNHSAERFKGTLSLLKKDAFDKLILKDGHFLASCRMDEGIKKAYRELNLLLIKANVGEGDLSQNSKA